MKKYLNHQVTTPASREHLLESAPSLLAARIHAVRERFQDFRKRPAAIMEKDGELWSFMTGQVIPGAKALDLAIRDNFYKALGFAMCIGALIGYVRGWGGN